MSKAIKLLKIDELKNGIIRLQSQLMIGRDTADFIIKNKKLKCYGNGKNGFSFYKYKGNYKIVENKKDMLIQPL